MGQLGVVLQIAWRNIFSSVMNLIIGLLILFGTFLVVVGGATLDSVDSAMSRSIIGSVAGDIQVYSSKSKDELSLFGQMGGEPDLSAFEDFSRLSKTLASVDNVKTVVPMGINGALVTAGNTLDLTLEKLRGLERDKLAGKGSATGDEQIASLKEHVRHMVKLLRENSKNLQTLLQEKAIDREATEAMEKASSDEFWARFDQEPLDSLEFLENRIAPLASDADMLYLRYVGTDLDKFQQTFDRMEIVDGKPVPPGQRGLLLSKFLYEEQIKLKAARQLDHIKEGLAERGRTIATDPVLQRWVKENQTQTREIVFQMDPIRSRQAVERLQKYLGSSEADLTKLLAQFFAMDDQSFQDRYRFFYEQLAPLVELYRIRPGDVLTIKAFTRTGYVQSINIPVYGTFQFKGLERSAVAGGVSLMDLVSFRDLYGYLTVDKLAEIKKIKEEAGAKQVDRANAEAELFGDGKNVVAEATPGVIDESGAFKGNARALREEELAQRVYSKDELENGVVLNAAVFLKDPKKLRETIMAIEKAGERDGLPIKAVSWQKASGFIGQFVLMAKLVLYFAVFIIFVVTMVVINNAMMMATIQRIREIGTLRAIGARRSFVLVLILAETALLGLVFGLAGAALGSGVMKLAGTKGIAAPSDIFYFFFSGPRLYPSLSAGNLIGAFVLVFVLSAASTLYPAIIATRVAPVTAMQTEE